MHDTIQDQEMLLLALMVKAQKIQQKTQIGMQSPHSPHNLICSRPHIGLRNSPVKWKWIWIEGHQDKFKRIYELVVDTQDNCTRVVN